MTSAVEAKSGAKTGPRYAEVSDTLQQRIAAGIYAVGALLPTELDLCHEFGISRHTVREALRRLSEAGLVQRRQGSGSQVISASPKGGYVHAMRSLNELFQYAADTHLRVDRIYEEVPSASLGAVLGDQAAQPWVILEGLRLDATGRQPICWSTVLINRAFAGIVSDFSTLTGAIYRLIEGRYDVLVDRVEQDIRAMPISAEAAAQLGVSRRIWAVQVVRRYLDGEGRLMLVSVNDHPGDRFSYSMQLQKEGRGRG
ncbi:MAG: GntR family transcriptional regulator [Alphaproteobacteria bacterium]